MKINSSLKTKQLTAISQDIQTSLNILSMSHLELEQFLLEEVQKNICLDFSVPKNQKQRILRQGSKEKHFSDLENIAKKIEYDNIYQYLVKQIHDLSFSDREKKVLLAMVSFINDDGYFKIKKEALIRETGYLEKSISQGLLNLKKLDPPGVGSFSLQECLIRQVELLKAPPLAKKVLENWSLFCKKNIKSLSHRLKTEDKEILDCIHFILQNCDPKPGRGFGIEETIYVLPEVSISKGIAGEWEVHLISEAGFRIRVNKDYLDRLASLEGLKKQRNEEQESAFHFIRAHLKGTQSLIRAVRDRRLTLLRVARKIFEKQQGFLEEGEEKLVPLSLHEIALELDLHESTISRATAHKYIQTPRGVFELKYFFHKKIARKSKDDVTDAAIKAWIHEFIFSENKKNPFSDEDLVHLIEKEKGVSLSRRTIAKYRKDIGVLNSSYRRMQFVS